MVQYFLDKNTDAGYLEVNPPHVVNEASGYGTGQLPDKEGQMYHVGIDDLYLIPTAEVPVTNIYRDVILEEKDFNVIVVIPKPFDLTCNPLSDVSIIGFSSMYFSATDKIKLSGDFLSKSLGSRVRSAVFILIFRLSKLSLICLIAF